MDAAASVRQNAAYHAQLLAAIAELDYVPPALEEQRKMITSLAAQARETLQTIQVLEKKTKKERKEHEALRDSTTRRFAAKITGRKEKFDAKASKEEREYIEALERETQEKRRKESLDKLISDAQAVKLDLENKLQRYNLTKQDLAELYSKVFDGPTQAYPEDDRLEYDLSNAQGRYNEIQGYLNRESQAVHLLKAANSALRGCSSKIQEALSYSTWDMFGGGGVSDWMERNALSSAEGLATQAATYVQQAMLASPQVKPIGQITVAHGSIMSDVIFDNIFTDMMFHDKIKASQRNVEAVQYNLTNELADATARLSVIGSDLSAAADILATARRALDSYRRGVFESASGGMDIPPLPSYDGGSSGDRGPFIMPQAEFPPPAGPPPTASPGIFSPPPGPPPTSSMAPPTKNYEPPMNPPPSGSSNTSKWGSRNPYAAALVASPPKIPEPLPDKQ
ncbi:hypothetical protein MIND_00967900 [Mycena indigotica]|uniref:Uncharacterized protein n=1 Tax=Mycena indigotica TaxID=2126181 RepID=A0A8H6SEK9_9AGAR|nr:uncharacterized protein MIND_00967900 [Mycena indigotica]KAF7297345.1 hypothetical protein MIND_00967900 [Mycena indigotica]